jgi:phage-related protein
MYEIIYFDTDGGRLPAYEFIRALEPKMRAKVLSSLALLEEQGPRLREPHSAFLRDGIYELKVKLGSNITRVLYFFVVGKRIILTNGFIKKTQKTPSGEIEKAIKYKKEYLERGNL